MLNYINIFYLVTLDTEVLQGERDEGYVKPYKYILPGYPGHRGSPGREG